MHVGSDDLLPQRITLGVQVQRVGAEELAPRLARTVEHRRVDVDELDVRVRVGVTWQGIALYAKLQPNAWFALVPRYEFLDDSDGFMTGASQNLNEFTLTAEFKHKDGVLMRVEYRTDMADADYFLKNTDTMVKHQNVFTVGWVYAFSSKTP